MIRPHPSLKPPRWAWHPGMTDQVESDDTVLVPEGARILLIYDGWCGICTRTVDWLRARDHAGRLITLPSQTPGLAERTGISRAHTDRAAWVVDRQGRRFAGAAAINRALWELGGGWRVVAWCYRLPLVRWAEQRGYRWFAAHRGRFARWGVVPGCARPGTSCSPEGV